MAVVEACDEWSALREVVVGTAFGAMFPDEDRRMIEATMPVEHWDEFRPGHPFPVWITEAAEQELQTLAELLESMGCRVHRPQRVPWEGLGGYCATMPRDSLLVMGDRVIEAPMAWRSRQHELLAYWPLIQKWRQAGARWLPADVDLGMDLLDAGPREPGPRWVIGEGRPAWDAADFLRLGPRTVVGQLSHVTNRSGVDHLRARLGPDIRVHLLQPDDPHAMHIDATLCPLREGLALYNPDRIAPEAMRGTPLDGWELVPAPRPEPNAGPPPRYMTSAWVSINLLVVDDRHVLVEAEDEKLQTLLTSLGFTPLPSPFRNVQALGGSFHCATLDIRRDRRTWTA
ncbi:amidinotransferase [Streptomyces sp. TBY4]|uniref:amidinotransferase n=1 Tax=Streptomyces sp. TBY4 TaxID=2962030 RepID=UPI0020B87205|nr:amidinotransferase [Streptomyces sp. TBY4]MCP3757014.1 amidinotransferase [Streptomyces sp. TBY4]